MNFLKTAKIIFLCFAFAGAHVSPATAQNPTAQNPTAHKQPSVYDLPALSFKAHHGRFGAWSSFTFGQWFAGGGIVQKTSKRPVPTDTPFEIAAHQSIAENARFPVCLPFTPSLPPRWTAYSSADVKRNYRLGTDEWTTPDFKFRVLTAFAKMNSLSLAPDELRLNLAPVSVVELEADNTKNAKDGFLYFGLGRGVAKVETSGARKILRGNGFALAIEDSKNLVSVARGRNIGGLFGTSPQLVLSEQNRIVDDGTLDARNEEASGGFSLKIPAGEKLKFSIILAHYTNETVINNDQNGGKPFRFFYTKLFDSLDAVVDFGLKNVEKLQQMAGNADRLLDESRLNDSRKFIVAHGVRSYLGNTALLTNADGKTLFAELEGEYEFVNTLDLIADHVFFTAEMFPFALKNQLDWYADFYSYRDEVKRYPSMEKFAGGVSFTHDMGQPPALTKYGTSLYEKPNIDPHKTPPGVRSFMTLEELTNWTLSAFVYWQRTNDTDWLRARRKLLNDLVISFENRDAETAEKRDGLPSLDSLKTGTGAEITTYDSLALDLALAVDSSYIAAKAWASQVALERMLAAIGDDAGAKRAAAHAELAAQSLLKSQKNGVIPARLDGKNSGLSLPAIEAAAYLINDSQIVKDKRWREIFDLFKTHGATVWNKNRRARGVALSDADTQIWYSKLAINQAALEFLINKKMPEPDDRRHAENIYTNGADEPYGDNWDAADGRRRENVRNYPRGAASWIWLSANGAAQVQNSKSKVSKSAARSSKFKTQNSARR